MIGSVDPAAAALIGAAVAAGVSLLAQLLAHSLSVQRDRRNQRRERAYETVRRAASALLRIDEPAAGSEGAREWPPDGIGALYPEAVPYFTRTTEALIALSVDFGRNHWLLDQYEKVASEGLGRLLDFHKHLRIPEDERGERIREIAGNAYRWTKAADEWVARAMEEVQRI
jgi:hypothetical protein